MRVLIKSVCLAVALATFATSLALAGATFDAVRERGFIRCGVGEQHMGFTHVDEKGRFIGFDVDFCRAVAAAVFGDGDRVQLIPLNNMVRLSAVQGGEVDVLIRTTTWTLSRDTGLGLLFAGVNFYDGQAAMVHVTKGLTSLKDAQNLSFCAAEKTTSLDNIRDYMRANGRDMKLRTFYSLDTMVKAFFAGDCDVFTDDSSALASIRASNAPTPDKYVILPERFSKEPLGPVVRNDDVAWFNIVKWVLFATLEAEELSLTSSNVATAAQSQNPAVLRFVGVEDNYGEHLGLDKAWALNIVSKVGNYGEIFERNIGPKTAVGLPRGQNRLWKDGGLMYAMPFR